MVAIGRHFFGSRIFGNIQESVFARINAMREQQSLAPQLIFADLCYGVDHIIDDSYSYFRQADYIYGKDRENLCQYLGMKDDMVSVDKLLDSYSYSREHYQLIRILKLFIHGYVDAKRTITRLEQYVQEHKPALWNLVQCWRHHKLVKFIESFKHTCMRNIIIDNKSDNMNEIDEGSDTMAMPQPVSEAEENRRHATVFVSEQGSETQFASLFRQDNARISSALFRSIEDYIDVYHGKNQIEQAEPANQAQACFHDAKYGEPANNEAIAS